MVYRKGSISDLQGLKQLGKKSYIEFSKELSGEHWDRMFIFLEDEKALKELISQSTVFVCEEGGGQLVGMVYFVPKGVSNKMYQENWSVIRYLGVNPDYRGKGIGRKLTEKCLQAAKDCKEEVVALHTSEFMYSAIKIYEELGFEKKGQFVHYGKNYWTYLLKL